MFANGSTLLSGLGSGYHSDRSPSRRFDFGLRVGSEQGFSCNVRVMRGPAIVVSAVFVTACSADSQIAEIAKPDVAGALRRVVQIAAAGCWGCALHQAGTVTCWGSITGKEASPRDVSD